jgi:hypothetical protein
MAIKFFSSLLMYLLIFQGINSQERKVLMIGIDGCRSDALNLANTPHIDSLINNGAFSLQAQTGNYTVSGAGWANTFTGVWENKHNITSNGFTSPNLTQYPHFFSLIKQQHPEKITASIERWKINNNILSDADYFTQRNENDFSDSMNAKLAANFLKNGFKPNYVKTNIPYNYTDISYLNSTYEINLNDDEVSSSINLFFNFDYFGITYNQIYISSNGYVTFSPADPSYSYNGSGCCESQNLPDAHYPNNQISLGWEDLDPPEGGQIFAKTFGTAPNRFCIIQFDEIEHTQSSNHVSSQIVLRESSNEIEIHVKEIESDGGYHSIGLENIDGSVGLGVSFSKNNVYQESYKLTYQSQNLSKDPDVLFVYFRDVDEKGHDHGFDVTVSEYMNQIELTDQYIGRILDSLEARPTYENEEWLITLSTDHGGICDAYDFFGNCVTGGHTGFQNSPEVKTIFYIVSNKHLTKRGPLFPAPNIVDMAPTILDFLCIDIDPAWDLDGESRGLNCAKPYVDFDLNINSMTVDFSDTVHSISCDSTLISWNFGDGSNSSESNPTHTFNSSGTFNVCLEATNECGTTQICKPLTFIFNDIKDKNKQFITIHPNPASDYVNINFGEKNIYKLKLYDLFGRLIIEINEISASDFKLKTDFLTSGQYMLEISDESLITHKALIIK